jgi:hypothetical protein
MVMVRSKVVQAAKEYFNEDFSDDGASRDTEPVANHTAVLHEQCSTAGMGSFLP